MKKVWILEGFISREHMDKELNDLYEMRNKASNDNELKVCDEMISLYSKSITKNPNGHWLGYQGKSIYRQFCDCAKQTLRYSKDVAEKWRVVEAEIQDDANTWIGYKVIKENPGVMRYLWATR